MRQKRYNCYLQEDASTNFNALSRKAIKQQQQQLQRELTSDEGVANALSMKRDEVIDNFGMLSNKSLKSKGRSKVPQPGVDLVNMAAPLRGRASTIGTAALKSVLLSVAVLMWNS